MRIGNKVFFMTFPAGIARGSHARRRSHEAWAPAHKIFLLENFVPPFDSLLKQQQTKIPSRRTIHLKEARGYFCLL
jgi:hypothetical protein